MKRRLQYSLLIFINILLIALFLIRYTNATFPLVGHDFSLFLSRLIDSHLFYKVNGFAIEWYTPSFGGGLPAYPNPLQMQFSLQQLLTFIVNPWIAALASAVVFISIGFWVTFLLLRDLLEFKPLSAVLGAVFFVANGFVIEQVVVGHVDKLTFPLIIIPVYALLNRKIPAWFASVLISITGAVLVYSGGAYIGVIGLFTVFLTIPVVYFLKPSLFILKKMLPVIGWGAFLTILLCGSKIYPVALFMRSFTREVHDHYYVDWLRSLVGLVFQLVGVMTSVPFLKVIGKSSLVFVVRLARWTGSPYGFWEMDTSISPALLGLLLYGIGLVLFHKPTLDRRTLVKKLIAGLLLAFFIVLVFQFSTTKGFLFEALKGWPVLKSLRTNTRFVASFVLPLVILGIAAFDHWIRRKSPLTSFLAFVFLDGISLVALWAYFLVPLTIQQRNFDTQGILQTYSTIQSGATFPVDKIVPALEDSDVFQAGASNVTHHYDPLLGENSFLPLVHAGSVYDENDGFYNMTDPSGYVFPAENNSKLFSRIRVTDFKKLVDFVNRRQSDWQLPMIQIILDWAAGTTFLLELLAVSLYPLGRKRWFRFIRQ